MLLRRISRLLALGRVILVIPGLALGNQLPSR